MSFNPTQDPVEGEPYVIRLAGELDERWQAWFDLTVQQQGDGTTVITGPIADQAALHGVLQRIRDLGIPLLSVTRIKAGDQATHRASPNHPNTKGDQP